MEARHSRANRGGSLSHTDIESIPESTNTPLTSNHRHPLEESPCHKHGRYYPVTAPVGLYMRPLAATCSSMGRLYDWARVCSNTQHRTYPFPIRNNPKNGKNPKIRSRGTTMYKITPSAIGGQLLHSFPCFHVPAQHSQMFSIIIYWVG